VNAGGPGDLPGRRSDLIEPTCEHLSVARPRLPRSASARSALAYAALFAAVGTQAPYLVLYYQSLGFDLGMIGLVIALAGVVGLVAAPAWGAVSDAFRGAPMVLLAATAVAVAGAGLLSQAREPVAVVLAATVMGIGFAGVSPILDARALETAGGDRSGYGPLRAWGSVSYIVAAFGTGVAIERWGIGSLFVLLAACLLATGLVGLTLRPASVQSATPSRLRAIPRLFGPGGHLGLFLLGAFVTWAAVAAVAGFYSLRYAELGAAASIIGLSSAVGAAVEVPIMLRFPWIAARLGAGRILVAGAAVFALRSLIAGLAADPALLVVAAGLGGVGYALFLIGGVTWVSSHAPPELAATAQGVLQGVSFSLSGVAAASIGGMIATSIGLTGLYLLAAAIGAIAVGIIALAVRRPAARAFEA
jgi:PPP family 3-phenylpropionic acid transporter